MSNINIQIDTVDGIRGRTDAILFQLDDCTLIFY